MVVPAKIIRSSVLVRTGSQTVLNFQKFENQELELLILSCLVQPVPVLWSTSEQNFSNTIESCCHGLCSVTFFPKNNHRMAPMESPMMATLPLFSATFTTSHPHQTYIGPPSEFFLYSDTTNKSSFLSLSLPTSTTHYPLQHNQSPTTLHTCSMS